MKIITDGNEIIFKGSGDSTEDYYNAKGSIMDKIKKGSKGLVGSGKVQGVLAALSGGNNGQGGNVVSTPAPEPEKPKMSMGVKIGIGVGVLALIGGIIYLVKRNK